MIKRILSAILLAAIIWVSISALLNIRIQDENLPTPSAQAETLPMSPQVKTPEFLYKVVLLNDKVYLLTFDSAGKRISDKLINSINPYALYPSQLDLVKEGVTFSNIEKAAEFIQDLGS